MGLDRRSNQMLRDTIMSKRTLLVFALIAVYVGPFLSQGYVFRQDYGVSFNAWGMFASTMSNARALLVCFVGYILMLSDLPRFSSAAVYEVVRSKRRSLMAVRVLMILKLTLVFLLLLFFLLCLLGGCTDWRFDTWDKVHYTYAHGQSVGELYVAVPGEMVAEYTPITAFMTSMFLLFFVFSGLGMGLLFFTMLLNEKKIVFAVICALAGLDMAIDEMGLGYRMYIASPLSYTRLGIIGKHEMNAFYPSKERMLIATMLLFVTTMIGCLVFPVNRRLDRLSMK